MFYWLGGPACGGGQARLSKAGLPPGRGKNRAGRRLRMISDDPTSMIELNPSDRFAAGYHRECFVDPRDEMLCIKIPFGRGELENRREVRYYRHLMRRKIRWDLLPRFHGHVRTNLGIGSVFDLVRDYDGTISRPLDGYLRGELDESELASLRDSLDSLRDYLIEERIITRTIKAKNILYNRVDREDRRLVIIDNIGNTDFIPFCTHIGFLAARKIIRKWRRFERDLRLPGRDGGAREP